MLLKYMLNGNSRRKASANLVCRWSDYPLVNKMINSYAHTREKKTNNTKNPQTNKKCLQMFPFSFIHHCCLAWGDDPVLQVSDR